MSGFDPNAAALPGSGVFGLPHRRSEAEVLLIPVPFAATVSGGTGAERGPAAIVAASHEVDLFDLQAGRPYLRGIHMMEPDPDVVRLGIAARDLAAPVVARGGAAAGDADAVAEVDRAGQRVNDVVGAAVRSILDEGKLPGVVGGDHSVPFGAIVAVAERFAGVGILHVDAHADLRRAFEGFAWSHASIMDNVLERVPGVQRIVQVGIRDVCDAEIETIQQNGGRVVTHFDIDWRRRLASGERLLDLCSEAIAALPQDVYVSFDIDGLDPSLCPGTGTPVPGGLLFHEACLLLEALQQSGRRVVGFDLCEVGGGDWDASVGARVLYKLCGLSLLTRS